MPFFIRMLLPLFLISLTLIVRYLPATPLSLSTTGVSADATALYLSVCAPAPQPSRMQTSTGAPSGSGAIEACGLSEGEAVMV